MKKLAKLLTLLFAVTALTFTLTACGGGSKPQPTTRPTTIPTPTMVDVQSVTLNQTAAYLNIGNTFVLTATVIPQNATDKTLTWTSSNPAVATVTNGTVLAVGEGTATVTATAHNGKSAQCVISVAESEILYSFTIDYSFYVVSGYKGYATSVSIPNIHNGLRVVGITDTAFKDNQFLQTITIPDTVESIGEGAFQGCTALKNIAIPGSVKAIGANAFKDCTNLTNITFASNIQLQTLEMATFQGCTALQNITLPESLTTIGIMAFDGCSNLQAITLPQSVTAVSHMAFRDCGKLASFRFNAGLKSVGNATFQRCVSLTAVELPESVTSIGASAFSDCSNLQNLRVLGDIETWGNSSFYKCVNLTTVYINSSISGDLGDDNYIFYDAGIQGEGITVTVGAKGVLPSGMFTPYGNENIPKVTELIFAEGVTAVNSQNLLPYLTKVTFPKTLVSLAPGLFNNNPNLTVEILLHTRTMYQPCWYNNAEGAGTIIRSVKNATTTLYVGWELLENIITFNGNGATGGEMATQTVYKNGNKTLNNNAFAKTHYTFLGWAESADGAVKYNNGATATFQQKENYTLYAKWELSENVITFNGNGATGGEMATQTVYKNGNKTLNNNAFTKTGYTFLGWAESATGEVKYQNGAEYTMGTDSEYILYAVWQEPYTKGLSFIKNGNTYSVTNYTGASTTVTIPAKYMGYPVTSIGSSAFENCASLTEITLPFVGATLNGTSNTHFGYIFGASSYSYNDDYVPTSLKKVTITGGTSIGSSAFYNCDSLTEIAIPDSVTSIGYQAFYSCDSLTTVTFGDNSQLTSIGYQAFCYCSSLTEIVIPTSVTSIGSYAFYECTSLTIYCEAERKPSGWNSDWNSSSRPVVWGYKGS